MNKQQPAKTSPATRRAIHNNNRKAYDLLSARAKKELNIPERLRAATAATGKSKAAYIVDAITAQLEQDEKNIPQGA